LADIVKGKRGDSTVAGQEAQQLTIPKFYHSIADEYTGYSDYYEGHGHAFEDENLVACIRLSVPVNYRETEKDLAQSLIDDLNSGDVIDVIDEAAWEQIKDHIDLEDIIRKEVGQTSHRAFDPWLANELEEDQDEYPTHIMIIHIYKEE
jgi:hypothetical protein